MGRLAPRRGLRPRRDGLAAGTLAAPFHVTDVDAHGHLSHGTNGYVHMLTDVRAPTFGPARRSRPRRDGVHEGNYLAYATGCQWVTDIDYIHGPGGDSDVHSWFMDGFNDGVDAPSSGDRIRLPHLTESDVCVLRSHGRPTPAALEPPVSIRSTRLEEFKADAGYDVICLCRSPEYPGQRDASDAPLYTAAGEPWGPPQLRVGEAGVYFGWDPTRPGPRGDHRSA